MNNKLQIVSGVGGDLYRGAFWYVGGSDRINISPTTGTGSIAKNLIVNGILVDSLNSLCPFWICGDVSANAATYTQTRGNHGYSCTRVGVGFYTMAPASPFSDTSYIVNITCQVDGSTAFARVVNTSVSTSSFQLITYISNAASDCVFRCAVIY
jgi:hypothetical protein